MYINPIPLAHSKLLNDYYRQKDTIMQYFDYDPFTQESMEERVADLANHSYDRDQLVDVLKQLNEKWHADKTVFANIERLKDPTSVVVIGGQQAGLLTGPLYTIHKMISIIVFAKKQEELLGIPVVPVFWIAGEDHDFAEINHIMLPEEQGKMKKHKITHYVTEKQSISRLTMDHQVTSEWLDAIFKGMDETIYTKKIYQQVNNALSHADTYVDFFAEVTSFLFQGEGLVLIDSGDSEVRQLENAHFQSMINQQHEISAGVYQSLQSVQQKGYAVSVEVEQEDAHLFYHLNGERILLVKTDTDMWAGKNKECQFTTQELLEVAEQTPELLSNNVVTRPLMQECLFPTLAFMAGPGELGYWSILKPAFHALGYKMPPVLPRLSFTLLDRKSEKKLNLHGMNVDDLIRNGSNQNKMNWLASQHNPPLDSLVEQVKRSIDQVHQPLRNIAKNIGPDLEKKAEKNLYYLFDNIDYLQEALEKTVMEKHHQTIEMFDTLQVMLHPDNGLQERCWNAMSFINYYGDDWIKEMIDQTYTFKHFHYLVKL